MCAASALCQRMTSWRRVFTCAPALSGAGATAGVSTEGIAVATRCSAGGSGFGGSGFGSATSVSSSGGLVSSLGCGVASLSCWGGPGVKSFGGVIGAAGVSGSSSSTTAAPASKSDASERFYQVEAGAATWASMTTLKQGPAQRFRAVTRPICHREPHRTYSRYRSARPQDNQLCAAGSWCP